MYIERLSEADLFKELDHVIVWDVKFDIYRKANRLETQGRTDIAVLI